MLAPLDLLLKLSIESVLILFQYSEYLGTLRLCDVQDKSIKYKLAFCNLCANLMAAALLLRAATQTKYLSS